MAVQLKNRAQKHKPNPDSVFQNGLRETQRMKYVPWENLNNETKRKGD